MLGSSLKVEIGSLRGCNSGVFVASFIVRVIVLTLWATLTLFGFKIVQGETTQAGHALVVSFKRALDWAILYLAVGVLVPQLLDGLV